MMQYDFSFEPFVQVCEKDTTYTYASGTLATSTEITECRNPFWDFWVFFALVVIFAIAVYKMTCWFD